MADRARAPILLFVAFLLALGSLPLLSTGGERSRSDPPMEFPDLRGVNYLSMGPSEFGPTVGHLLDWKEVRGMSTAFVPLEAVLSDDRFTGRDLQETFRNFLVHAKNESEDSGRSEGIIWVLLCGDGEIIPPRYVFVNHSSDYGADDPLNYVPTDFYYAGLDGDWDLDGDGVYGEDRYYGDEEEADLEADVYVGRFAASNVSELSIMVERQLAYEKDPPPGPWASSMLLAGSLMDVPNVVDNPGTPVDEGYNEYKDNAYKVIRNITASLPPDITAFTLTDYPKLPPGGYNRLFDTLNRSSFTDMFEMGHSTVFLACHGDENGNATDYRGDYGGTVNYFADYEVYLDYESARTIDNSERTPLLYVSNCGSLNFTEEDDTNLETMMLNEEGGAIGIIGASTETYRGEMAPVENKTGSYGNWWLAEEFFRILYGDTPHPAEALYRQKWNYEVHIWKEMQPFTPELFRAFRIDSLAYNLLGDPEGPIWLHEPRILNVSGVTPHIVTEPLLRPLVMDMGTGEPVEGAVVHIAYFGDPGSAQTARTDSDGRASFVVEGGDLSDLLLTVTSPGYLPRSTFVDVVSLINLGLRNLTVDTVSPTALVDANFSIEVFNNGSLKMKGFYVMMTLGEGEPKYSMPLELSPGSVAIVTKPFEVGRGINVLRASIVFVEDPIQTVTDDDTLTYEFTANDPVMIIGTLPKHVVLDEDMPLSTTTLGPLQLWAYFSDPDGALDMGDFKASPGPEDLERLTPSIVLDALDRPVLDILPAENWYGEGVLLVEATDGPSTVSAILNVTVRAVPDKPVPASYPESVLAREDHPTNFTVVFTDPDSTDLVVTTPLDWVEVAPGAGPEWFNITVTPGEAEVGNMFINLTATDGTGLNATLLIPLRVEPTNDPPRILGGVYYHMTAGKELQIDLMVEDDSTGPWNVTAEWEFQRIVTNGSILRLKAPADAKRGTYQMTVNVTDSEGSWTVTRMTIEIDRRDVAILPITIIVVLVVIAISVLIGYSVYSRLEEKRLSETLSSVSGPGPLPELTMDDFRAGEGNYLAMPPSQLEGELSEELPVEGETDEDEVVVPAEDLDGDIDDVIGEFYKG